MEILNRIFLICTAIIFEKQNNFQKPKAFTTQSFLK